MKSVTRPRNKWIHAADSSLEAKPKKAKAAAERYCGYIVAGFILFWLAVYFHAWLLFSPSRAIITLLALLLCAYATLPVCVSVCP